MLAVLRIIRISIILSINTDNTLGLQASYTKPTFTASRYIRVYSSTSGTHTVHQRTQQAQLLVTFYVELLSMEPLIPDQVASSEDAT